MHVQWKAVLSELSIDIIYALSPQTKGKIERPYCWLQDHLVRTCMHQHITSIDQARDILYREVYQYNYQRIHSTTGQIPMVRFKQAKNLFVPFKHLKPGQRLEDLFCYRTTRVNAYRKISLGTVELPVHGVPIRETIDLKISFNQQHQTAKVRLWHQQRFIAEHIIALHDLKSVQF